MILQNNGKLENIAITYDTFESCVSGEPTSSSSEHGNKGSSLISISETTDISAEKCVYIVMIFSLNINLI